VLGADERRSYNDRAPDNPALKSHTDSLAWAEAIVFVYPTWWYGLPAMLKGWFDRVWATDIAFRLPPDRGRIISLVSHIRKIGIVTTCGAPWWFSFLIGQPGRKTILRGIRALCAPRARTMYLAHYSMDQSTPESRAAYLATVKRRLAAF
jgi:NAD(P)H dehydrogenase (quinone)